MALPGIARTPGATRTIAAITACRGGSASERETVGRTGQTMARREAECKGCVEPRRGDNHLFAAIARASFSRIPS